MNPAADHPLPADSSTLDWLLEPENPSVRYFALTRLLGCPEASPEAAEARSGIMMSGLVPRILAAQNADGSWDEPSRFYTAKYTGTVWNLLILAELAADPAHPGIQRACDFLLEHAFCPETGGFAIEASARTGTGLASQVIPCLTGNLVASLTRLGRLDDARVQAAIDWIVTWQRTDDGEPRTDDGEPLAETGRQPEAGRQPDGGRQRPDHAGLQANDTVERPDHANPYYQRMSMCFGRHSCHMGVAKAMKGLAAIPPDRRSEGVSRRLAEFAEYFLIHHLYRKSHDLSAVARPGWLRLGFPLMYQTDILELAGIIASLGIRDPRLEDALAIIAGKRRPDGRWRLENTFNGKMLVEIEAKGQASKWITLKALDLLGAYGLERPAQDQC